MKAPQQSTLAVACVCLIYGISWAEVSPDPDKFAPIHVTGVVLEIAVERRTRDSDKTVGGVDVSANEYAQDNHFVIRLAVASVEKGPGMKAGSTIRVTCFQLAEYNATYRTRPNYCGGQKYIPRVGELVRAHLLPRNDGIYEALYFNGFVSLDPRYRAEDQIPYQEMTRPENFFLRWWPALFTLCAGGIMGYWWGQRQGNNASKG